MIYNLLLKISSLPLTYYLAEKGHQKYRKNKLGDQKCRKVTICVPLLGYLVSRSLLVLVIMFDLSLEVMFATALLNGLSRGSPAFWSGVMAFASDTSSQEKRSIRLNGVKLANGVAAMVGSVTSGHLFTYFKISHDQGAGLMVCSCIFYTLSLLCSAPGLKSTQTGSRGYGSLVDQGQQEIDDRAADEIELENTTLNESQSAKCRTIQGFQIILEVAGSFPRACATVASLCKLFQPVLFYLVARAVMMFALIPLATIRSVISKQRKDTSYG
ncbi:solute carrier family 46 member 2-like [Cetorhinus maximus]